MDKLSLFIWNIFINSILTFFTVTFLIEGIIFLLRIKQGRLLAMLRMIPLLKLPYDLFAYDFAKWSYSHGINPLTCEKGSRILTVAIGGIDTDTSSYFNVIHAGIQFFAPGGMTFTIADVTAQYLPAICLRIFSLILLSLCAFLIVKKLALYLRFMASKEALFKTAQVVEKPIYNSALKRYIQQRKVQVFSSSSLKGSPFVIGLFSPRIFFPQYLLKSLSSNEYEAALAHELEHIRYKDNLSRFLLDLIGTCFFWIPSKWLRKRIEEGKEISCDLRSKDYGIHPLDLASVISKAAKHIQQNSHLVFYHHLARRSVLYRVEALLNTSPRQFKKLSVLLSCFVTLFAFFVIFLGRFWIF